MSIIKFDPATLVELKVGELTAPVMVGVEMSKLYVSANEIIKQLMADMEIDEEGKLYIPGDLLPWYKEQRMLLGEIYKLTGEVEQKANERKLEMQMKLFAEYFKDLTPVEKIKYMKSLNVTEIDE